MAEAVLMLALSPTMEEGTITRWHKKEGEMVASGEVIGHAGGAMAFGKARLYFEIRRGSESLDPTQWLERH